MTSHVYSSTKIFESHFDFQWVYFRTFKCLVRGWESLKHLTSMRSTYKRGGGLAFSGWDLQEGSMHSVQLHLFPCLYQ